MNKTGAKQGIFFQTTFYSPQENIPSFDWSNYLVLGLFITLITLGVLGSIMPRLTEDRSIGIKALQSFSFYDNFAKIVDMSGTAEN